MNDKDIPVTTLAGLTSLSDCKEIIFIEKLSSQRFFLLVLSELPLSDTLPSHSNTHKSLLFHPRVAEEANNLLSQRDDALVQQLVTAIEQTNSSHMWVRRKIFELKILDLSLYFSDIKAEFAGNEELSTSDSPHLLRVIQSYKPNVFNAYNQKFGKLS